MSSHPHEIFRFKIQVQHEHLDLFGHVNNAAYLVLYEQARWDFISANGYGRDHIKTTRQGPVLLDVYVKFKREIVLGEWITIVSTPAQLLGNKLLKLNQHMEKADGTIASEALFTVGLFDLEARKLLTPSRDWLEAVGWEKKKLP